MASALVWMMLVAEAEPWRNIVALLPARDAARMFLSTARLMPIFRDEQLQTQFLHRAVGHVRPTLRRAVRWVHAHRETQRRREDSGMWGEREEDKEATINRRWVCDLVRIVGVADDEDQRHRAWSACQTFLHQLRFPVGTLVECRMGWSGSDDEDGEDAAKGGPGTVAEEGSAVKAVRPERWEAGVVVHVIYREDDWEVGDLAPYQIRLESGTLIYAPSDDDDTVRARAGTTAGEGGPSDAQLLAGLEASLRLSNAALLRNIHANILSAPSHFPPYSARGVMATIIKYDFAAMIPWLLRNQHALRPGGAWNHLSPCTCAELAVKDSGVSLTKESLQRFFTGGEGEGEGHDIGALYQVEDAKAELKECIDALLRGVRAQPPGACSAPAPPPRAPSPPASPPTAQACRHADEAFTASKAHRVLFPGPAANDFVAWVVAPRYGGAVPAPQCATPPFEDVGVDAILKPDAPAPGEYRSAIFGPWGRGRRHRRPMEMAGHYGHEACMCALVSLGCNVQTPAANGFSVLYAAVLENRPGVVRCLLRRREDGGCGLVATDTSMAIPDPYDSEEEQMAHYWGEAPAAILSPAAKLRKTWVRMFSGLCELDRRTTSARWLGAAFDADDLIGEGARTRRKYRCRCVWKESVAMMRLLSEFVPLQLFMPSCQRALQAMEAQEAQGEAEDFDMRTLNLSRAEGRQLQKLGEACQDFNGMFRHETNMVTIVGFAGVLKSIWAGEYKPAGREPDALFG